MNRTSLTALAAAALALMIPTQALACRVGGDWNLFEERPAANVLPGAEIIRVRFSTAAPLLDRWPRFAANPDGSQLNHTLIGKAGLIRGNGPHGETFPVYAFVTSCSPFHSMTLGRVRHAIDADYYLVGRFVANASGRRFHAAGRRMHGGQDIYGGWHF